MPPTYHPGQPIPGTQYAFTRILGAGGHGAVYAVEHTFLQAPAVMKLLHAELSDNSDLAARMTREARTLAKLRHPNIVEVRDGGITAEDPPRPFFVMEPLSGMSLRELRRNMKGRGVGVLSALRIVIGVLEGLHHAHAAGVIHRDIKPDNIFLHRTSTDLTVPKVLDFGIAHLFMGQNMTGRHFLGTPRYAAPEQMRGEPVGPTTDIYATGLVLHELITGAAPYADKKELGPLLMAHLNEKLPRISEVVPDAPPGIDDFLDYLLDKDPTRRPPTAFAAAVAAREIRSYIEARQDGSIHATDFKTEPSPMDNFLIEASPGDPGFVTESAPAAVERRRAPVIQHTVPMAGRPGHDDPALSPRSSSPAIGLGHADTTPAEPDMLPVPRAPAPARVPPRVERTPAVRSESRPRSTSSPVAAASAPPPPLRLRDRHGVVFALTLTGICAVGLPFALSLRPAEERAPASAPPSAVPSTAPSALPASALSALPASALSASDAAAPTSSMPQPRGAH